MLCYVKGWDVERIKSRLDNSDPTEWWQQFVDNMSPVIKRVVSFCRRIHGNVKQTYIDALFFFRPGIRGATSI